MAREMKDSGIAWIGEIPREWATIRFKYLHNGLNTGEAIDKEYWTDDDKDCFFYTAGSKPIRTSYSDFPSWKYTNANDLLLARNGTPYVYFPAQGACYTDHIIRAAMKADINRRFVQYCLQQSIMSIVVDSVSLATWSASLWNEQSIAWPPAEEQRRIADFLDAECARIDAVIEKTRASIEEYKKLKQSVITQAVTKGIRPGRKMKDSGIEWIGEIPEEWEVLAIKYVLNERNDRTLTGEGEQLSVNQKKGVVKAEESGAANPAQTTIDWKVVEKGDIVFNKYKAHSGVFFVSNYNGIVTFNYSVFRCKNNKSPKFFEYFFKTDGCIGEFKKQMRGVGDSISPLYTKDLFRVFAVVPPLREQQEIVAQLDIQSDKIDSIIWGKNNLISELEAYKKSLIYEYVTGKKEVV